MAQNFQSNYALLCDQIASAMVAAKLTPQPPQTDYPSLYPVQVGQSARALALRLEEVSATYWRFLYAEAAKFESTIATALRIQSQENLNTSATQALQWRKIISPSKATTAFPGI